jgi:hypothetical protein
MKRRFFFLAPLLVLVGCSGGNTPSRGIDLNQEVVVGIGESVLVNGEGTTMTAGAILEDSRCPANADCISAGRIRVRFQIVNNKGTFSQEASLPQPLVETTEAPASGYRPVLSEVTPLPTLGKAVPVEDYRLTVKLIKVP